MALSDYNIYFFGGVYPKEIYDEIYSKSKKGLQNAANNLQWSIIKGIDYNVNRPINIVNLMFIGSFPKKYEDIKIKQFKFSHTINAYDYNLGFINLSILKEFSRLHTIKKYIRSNKKLLNNNQNIIILYSVQSIWLSAAKLIKKYNRNIHICLIVPDLPNYMSMQYDKRILHKFYKKYLINKTKKYNKYIDSYVYLTDQMKYYFNPNKPYIVVEGMMDPDNYPIENHYNSEKQKEKIIMYSGTLTKKYGVLNLVEAFTLINSNNYRLIICGEGETQEDIIEFSKKDNRIMFMGLLKYDKVRKLQQNATILINPRKNDDEYTKYSFPSKIIEYMFSGTPVVAYKLDGIPNDYDNYIYYIDNNSIQSMTDKIIEVCEKTEQERKNFGNRAKEFILKNKCSNVQTKKIIEMINESLIKN